MSDTHECEGEIIRIDAATEMGKLIELLGAPKEVVVENVILDVTTHGNVIVRDGVISPDGATVRVGCSTATFKKVEEVYMKMLELRK